MCYTWDLMVNKSIINPMISYLPGDILTYEVVVYNSGTYFPGTDVEITDSLPV